MEATDNKSTMVGSLWPSTSRAQSKGELSGVSAGRSIAIPVKKETEKNLFFNLPLEVTTRIIRSLEVRDVACLQQVCHYFNGIIKNDHELERAWYRQFSSPHRYQLNKILPAKDKEQLRNWLRPFTKDEALIESVITQREQVYFPDLFYFTKARLVSECTRFKVDREIFISHYEDVFSAIFSANGTRLVTGGSHGAKICGQKANGFWEEEIFISHVTNVRSATFSADGRHVATASKDRTAKIYGQVDGSWEAKLTISHDDWVNSATFSADSRHLVTASMDTTAKICVQGADGSWEEKLTISHDGSVNTASFSPDGCYVVTASDDNTAKIYCQRTDGSWVERANIFHDKFVLSATFSPDSRHVVTVGYDHKVKIVYGSWASEVSIDHDDTVTSATFSADSRHLVTAIGAKAI